MRIHARGVPRVLEAFLAEPWALLDEKLAEIEGFLLSYLEEGVSLDTEELERLKAANEKNSATRTFGTSVAVIPVRGTLFPRANMMMSTSGGASYQKISEQVRAAAQAPEIGAMVLDFDSPGGAVTGLEEAAAEVRAAVKLKPVVAHANFMMASAAYWLGSQATEIAASPSADVGSIGVLAVHQDMSRALEARGIGTTMLRAGKYKGLGNPYEPLSEEARGLMQARVDEAYDKFITAVAQGRQRKESEVRGGFGEGRVLSARTALREGMVDRIETLEQTLQRVSMQITRGRRATAAMAKARALALTAEPTEA